MMSPTEKTVKSKTKSASVTEKKIPLKNYVYSLLILVGGIILTLYIFEWVNVKKEAEFMNSYLITSNTIDSTINDFDSLNQILKETSSSYFIYLSYTGVEDIYNFEKELKRVIDNYNISDNFYYMDLTEIKKNNKNYMNEIKEKLEINNIDRVPALIYVHKGKIEKSNILDGVNNTMLKTSDIENLLDIYEFELVK